MMWQYLLASTASSALMVQGGGGGGSVDWRFANIDSDYNTRISVRHMYLADASEVALVPDTSDYPTLTDGADTGGVYFGITDNKTFAMNFASPVWPAKVYVEAPSYAADAGRTPTSWKLQYSDDGGTNWTTAYELVDDPQFSANEGRWYDIPAP